MFSDLTMFVYDDGKRNECNIFSCTQNFTINFKTYYMFGNYHTFVYLQKNPSNTVTHILKQIMFLVNSKILYI